MPTGNCVGGPMHGQSYTGGGTVGVIFIGEDGMRHAYAWDEGTGTFRYMMLAVNAATSDEVLGNGKWETVDLP